ncbi:MAG: hypothetical protein ACRDZ4_11505 [Egibacteraceae bacterium]
MSGNRPVRYCSCCGARLARDNPDTRCSPCQQRTRDLTRRPPQVPPGFWDIDQLRDALDSRHMGCVVRAYRHHPFHGGVLPQALVGGWLGITQAQLSRIEHGPPVADLDKLVRWAQSLRIPARLLWFDLPGQRRDTPPDQGQSGFAGEVFPDGDVMMVWVVETIDGRPVFVPVPLSRRKVLAAGGAGLLGALAGALDPDELARVQAAVVTPSRTDMTTVGHFAALLAHYRRLDDQLGPRGLLTPVQSTLDLVDGLRKAARPDVGQALRSLSAQYEQLTGWLWVDSGNQAMAERAYDRALARATEAGDHALAEYVLLCKCDQALVEGCAETALDLAQAAQAAQAGQGRLTPAVHAFAAMKEARAWALDGKTDECKRKLDEAVELLAASAENGRAEEPPWIYHFAEEALTAQRGVCLTDLGEAGPAIEVFDRAIPALPAEQVRDCAYHLIWSAKAHSGNNDPEQAGVVGQKAARIAIATGSGRILEKLNGLHAALSETHKDVRAVRELGELLRPASARPGTGAAPHE